MTTVTKIGEALSGVLLLAWAWRNSHHGISTPLLVVEAIVALGVAWTFPRTKAASIAAIGLAVAVIASVLYQGGIGGMMPSGLHSPAVGFAFFPVAFLVLAQLVATVGACLALARGRTAVS